MTATADTAAAPLCRNLTTGRNHSAEKQTQFPTTRKRIHKNHQQLPSSVRRARWESTLQTFACRATLVFTTSLLRPIVVVISLFHLLVCYDQLEHVGIYIFFYHDSFPITVYAKIVSIASIAVWLLENAEPQRPVFLLKEINSFRTTPLQLFNGRTNHINHIPRIGFV